MQSHTPEGSRRITDMVRDVLADQDLDPTVRALAIERLEAALTERAVKELGGEREVTVRLGDDGVARIFTGETRIDDARLSSRLDLDLVARLAPTVGAARIDVKRGARPSKPRPLAAPDLAPEEPLAPVSPWVGIARRLTSIARSQNARIAALEAALGAPSNATELRDFERELREIEAAIEVASRS